MKNNTKKTTITVPVSQELAKKLRVYAASENINQGEIVEKAVLLYLEGKNDTKIL